MKYVLYDSSGEVVGGGDVPDQAHYDLVAVPAGCSKVLTDAVDYVDSYYPAGVKTSRPAISQVASWNKTTILGNGADSCRLGNNLPNPTTVTVEFQGQTQTHVVTTGAFVFSTEEAGEYQITAEHLPHKPLTTLITVTKAIAQRRAERWTVIKALRSAREYGTFTWNGLTFDADAESQRRIQGAVQLAQLAISQGSPFSIDWTLADDSVETLSAADMVAVGVALGQHVQTQHATGRALRQQIIGANSQEDLDAIVWPS